MKVVIVGGGWAGCAASASGQGAEVHLVERADMLLGTGLAGGIMRNNGRFTATEEMIAMEGGDVSQLRFPALLCEFASDIQGEMSRTKVSPWTLLTLANWTFRP